ncbi:hypothetical protein ABZ930_23160 [Streptomyces sp. NPDC046716]|uniref:hypothetical protein n=1 Tax=Streptomyces sp. NPDC046716 TaxID=3157093 RepID=UPI0033E9BE53
MLEVEKDDPEAIVAEARPSEDAAMSEATSTVIAAVVAFAAAVMGAGIAGVYAKRAAEAGGRKAVDAALTQVHGQAAAEHWQWVRSQRHQAFAALLAAYVALDELFVRIAPQVRGGSGIDEATGHELRQCTLEVRSKTSQLALWGPSETNLKAYELTSAAMASVQDFMRAADASSVNLSSGWSSFDRSRDQMTEAYSAFLQRAGEVMRDPRQPVS